jgi:hypothetical protein
MDKREAKDKFAALFQRCWEAFDADDIGRGGPFDYVEWLNWADELGLIVENPDPGADGEGYILADGVARALPSGKREQCTSWEDHEWDEKKPDEPWAFCKKCGESAR